MCMKNEKTLQSKTDKELERQLAEVIAKEAHLRFQHASNQLRSTHEVKELRKLKARLMTAIKTRTQAQGK